MTYRDWLENVGWAASNLLDAPDDEAGFALSCLVNAIAFGRPDESLSSRLGRSILANGVWAYVPIPPRLALHFIRSAQRSTI